MITRVVSGGQTGVDRGALDAALRAGIACGGWCPQGRLAEDGRIPARYPLTESESREYAVRTRLNVEDSDATLIICEGAPEGGTALTIVYAKQTGRPYYVADLSQGRSVEEVLDWLRPYAVQTLNVAGPRESTVPGIAERADAFMTSLLAVDAGD